MHWIPLTLMCALSLAAADAVTIDTTELSIEGQIEAVIAEVEASADADDAGSARRDRPLSFR